MNNEMAVCEENGTAPNQLIALALERNADPTTLSKLMDLQERWEAGRARKAYVAAMTAFKQEAPAVLKKNDKVDFQSSKGRTAYNYANLGSIVQEITAVLGKHHLSASWSTDQKGPDVTVTCNITHAAGHRESVTLTGPIDESGNKNRIQAVGSTVTYLQRYTLLAALGLATGEDDDGRQVTETKPPKSSTVQPPKQAAQAPAQPPKQKESGQPKIKEPDAPCTDAQAKAIHSMLSKLNIEAEYHHSYAAQQIGLEFIPESMYDLTKGQASEIIDSLNKELNG